ncbi:hypothetical protein GCK32_004093 [Trichostrongylus colubriformis]|uniref:Uncharacterized protein n=1 Tax=Trichostrongylus colubriformis TaxID=6319 RepID=A0AAN8IIK2_TRICO
MSALLIGKSQGLTTTVVRLRSLRGGFLRLFYSKTRLNTNNTRLFMSRVQPKRTVSELP